MSQKRNVVNVTPAEPAKPAASQPILKRRMHINHSAVVTFSVGRMTGEVARLKTERALMFNNIALHSRLREASTTSAWSLGWTDAVVPMETTESLVASVAKA
jgi:hypothetical protein